MNMLWGKGGILSVIDWEFCGAKPMLYDAAIVIGCVGVEAPEAAEGGFVRRFTDVVNERLFPAAMAEHLPYFVVAQRFAWLSEWLRRSDREMIEFEIAYMRFLIGRL
jgi:homoserine kinase type II